MKNEWDETKEFLVTFADAKKILSKAKKKILITTTLFALLGLGYALTKPITYEIFATFREKTGSGSNSGNGLSLSSLLTGGNEGGAKQEAVSILKSRLMSAKMIQTLNLQAVITPLPNRTSIADTILNNIRSEYARLKKHAKPNIPDVTPSLIARDVLYQGEVPLGLTLKVLPNDEYELKNDQQTFGIGRFNEPFVTDAFALTIIKNAAILQTKSFSLTLLPLNPYADALADKIDVAPDLKNKSLIKISYMDSDRHRGAAIVNTLMESYQKFLRDEQRIQTAEQIAYLKRRQKEENDSLRQVMLQYANERYNDIASTGFYDPKSTIEFISASQREHVRKSQDIDFEVKRLKSALEKGCVYYDQYSTRGDSHVINDLLGEMRMLKKESNEIDFTLKNASLNAHQTTESSFTAQLAQIENTKNTINQLKEIGATLQQDILPSPPENLINDPKYMLEGWFAKLKEYKTSWDALPQEEKEKNAAEWNNRKTQFLAYLTNLIHFFQAQEKTLQEQLAHQGSAQTEFQGISLKLARDLYLTYCTELDHVQSAIMNNQYVIDNLQNPEFEVSSLKSIVQDSISQSIIDAYTSQLLQLKDLAHRSPREQERLREELTLQRGFLEMHLTQTNQVLNLRTNLLKDKILNLQKITLALIHQRSSILHKQLQDYIKTRVSSLEDEKKVIANQQTELNTNLSDWPQKWIDETLIDQQLKSSISMSQEIARLVETKNINTNLDAVLSGPIDIAIAPTYPKSPKLVIFTLLGAFVGAFFSASYFLIKESVQGVTASAENIRSLGIHVSGTLSSSYNNNITSPLHDNDLDTLRHLLAFFLRNSGDNGALLMVNNGPNYSHDLAVIAAKKGLKVLLVPASLHTAEDTSNDGLLQYLEGKINTPTIHHNAEYDMISPGGFTRYSNELIASARYRQLVEKLKNDYDLVIATSTAAPTSAEAENLQHLFLNVGVTIVDQKLETLKSLIIKTKRNPDFHLTFVCLSNEESSLS